MKRENFDSLVDFCASQYVAFDESAWISTPLVDAKTLAIAANFLAMTEWYGHDDVLSHITFNLHPPLADINLFTSEATAIGFEFGRFSSTLKMKISHHA